MPESNMPLAQVPLRSPDPLSYLKPLQPLPLFLVLSYLQVPVNNDLSLLNQRLPPPDDALPLPQLSLPLQLVSPPLPHPLLDKLGGQGSKWALPPPLQQVEEEGAEGEDCQARQSPAMQGVQARDHIGSTEADAKGQSREAQMQGVPGAEAVGSLGLEPMEREEGPAN